MTITEFLLARVRGRRAYDETFPPIETSGDGHP